MALGIAGSRDRFGNGSHHVWLQNHGIGRPDRNSVFDPFEIRHKKVITHNDGRNPAGDGGETLEVIFFQRVLDHEQLVRLGKPFQEVDELFSVNRFPAELVSVGGGVVEFAGGTVQAELALAPVAGRICCC